jgi:peptide/nickel transport system substrate-binding protein
MNISVRRLVALVAMLPLLAALGCRREPPAPPAPPRAEGPRQGGQVIVATFADVTTFNDYQSAGEVTESEIIDLLYPTLMVEQPDYRLHPPSFAPRLATSWEYSPDGRTVTFHLRPDARWSDGVPITAEDVRFTFTAQKDARVGWTDMELKDFIKDVVVVDPLTVRFVFSRAYPYQLMDANDGHIVPAHAFGKIPFERWRTADFEPGLVTGGPFRLAGHTPQQTIILERDPSWWGTPRPYLDRLVFRVLPEIGSQLGQLLAGEVHLVPVVPAPEAARIQASPDLQLVEFPSRTYGLVFWNNRNPLFADRRVRRALSLAVNRKSLVDTLFQGHARLSNGPVLSSMWAYNDTLPQLPYDPKLAGELLAQTGWRPARSEGTLRRGARSFTFDLLYPAGNTMRQQMALLIQTDLARLGVHVRPLQVEFTSLIARLESGDYEAVIWAWTEATKVDLTALWGTPGETEGTDNYLGYSNPELDRLIAAAREETDVAKAKALFDRAQALIVEDQPVTFLYEADQLVGMSRHLRGADINAASVYFNVADWYWDPQ